ncbi:hypothetical protein ZIOFF_031360 [Zingiber officinale]|uniref:dUTP diphosphatase n=1 Tax=Zingiber officinale TaxID=94328 RepID=A0A8J5L525_ZINOF|nr:hypothetical protein ZIOFF_031360 [Zingiber officinale]
MSCLSRSVLNSLVTDHRGNGGSGTAEPETRSGISRLSGNMGVSEISKITSNFLPFRDEEVEEEDDDDRHFGAGVIGITDEVMSFVHNISMHAETWWDFTLFNKAGGVILAMFNSVCVMDAFLAGANYVKASNFLGFLSQVIWNALSCWDDQEMLQHALSGFGVPFLFPFFGNIIYPSKKNIIIYASGKFSPPKSTIDAEIHAVMNSLNNFKIYYLDKEEILIRTDFKGPYRLLDQYESLTQGRSPNPEFLGPGEKELRIHLEDIEWTAASHVLNHIWELKLILNAKEKDFYYRGQYNKGLYFKDALPEVTKTKEALLDLFIRAQSIVQRERAAIVPAEVLYHSRRDDTHHRVYMHRSEEAMLVTSNQVDRAFIQPESFIQLQRSGMRFLHMGVIQVRIQILHRQEEGTLALIIFRDNRWQGDQSIFATMEVDLTHGSQMVYVIPDTMLTISDFYQNIQVSILTRGYENWQNGEANLLITRGLVGRLSNTPNVGFAYNIQNVVDYLTSHGVRALPGRRYNTRDIQGHNWVIRQSTIRVPMQPTEVNTRNLLDGSISLQFDAYQPATTSSPVRYNSKDEEILSDEEEITNHTIAVLTEETIKTDELLVQRITPTALLPQRKSSGAAGYDIAVDQEYNLKAQKQMSLTTGICIQVPKGTYARIASRSSYALQGVIIMGGVIDTDYRGGVKILAYNSSNDDIYLKKQTYIAQLILERISNPLVREVTLLQNTQRGDQGFGSTTIQVCSKNRANPLCSGCYYCCSDEDCAQEYDFYIQPDKGKTLVSQEEQIERQAQRRHAMQYKSFEEEAYQNLICGPKSLPLTQAARQLRNSREYRQQLQILHSPPLNTESSQSSSSTKFLATGGRLPEAQSTFSDKDRSSLDFLVKALVVLPSVVKVFFFGIEDKLEFPYVVEVVGCCGPFNIFKVNSELLFSRSKEFRIWASSLGYDPRKVAFSQFVSFGEKVDCTSEGLFLNFLSVPVYLEWLYDGDLIVVVEARAMLLQKLQNQTQVGFTKTGRCLRLPDDKAAKRPFNKFNVASNLSVEATDDDDRKMRLVLLLQGSSASLSVRMRLLVISRKKTNNMLLKLRKDESGFYHVEIAWKGLDCVLFPVAADSATMVSRAEHVIFFPPNFSIFVYCPLLLSPRVIRPLCIHVPSYKTALDRAADGTDPFPTFPAFDLIWELLFFGGGEGFVVVAEIGHNNSIMLVMMSHCFLLTGAVDVASGMRCPTTPEGPKGALRFAPVCSSCSPF